MCDYYDEIILDMDEDIHWSSREKENFLEDKHPDVNTFIIINESKTTQFDFIKTSYLGELKKYDNIFTVGVINEYISIRTHILHIYGTIGYSLDTENTEFIYDKKNNKIYVCGDYRLTSEENEYELFKDTFEICYDKYWDIDKNDICDRLSEMTFDEKYEKKDNMIPYYIYPRTKDGISIPRIIYNVFKIFSDVNVPKENKPKIIVPIFNYKYKRIIQEKENQ